MIPAHRTGGGGNKYTGNASLVIRDEVQEAQRLGDCGLSLRAFLWQQVSGEVLEAVQ